MEPTKRPTKSEERLYQHVRHLSVDERMPTAKIRLVIGKHRITMAEARRLVCLAWRNSDAR
jgi:hypothetical protein